ncbi:FHA domain-containing protein [Microbacterium sp. OR16]|uniref:FHA domain-containing protein n=1 Tax=Microbacterium sp. OR16 TaxID=3095345 RepID=UPI0039B4BDAB
MNQFAYRPGSWQVVAEEHGMIAVPGDTATERLAALTEMMRSGAPQLTEVIDVLGGGTMATLGSFAVALLGEDSARLAVRGDIRVTVTGVDGDEVVSGAEISTWTERYFTHPRSFTVSLEEAHSDTSLVVRSGTVLASSVAFPHGDQPAASATAAPGVAEPVEAGAGDVAPPEDAAPAEKTDQQPADAGNAAFPAQAGVLATAPQAEGTPVDEVPADGVAAAEAPAATESADEAPADAPGAEQGDAAEEASGSGAEHPELVQTEAMPVTTASDPSGVDAGFPTLIPTEYTFAPAPPSIAEDDVLDATVHSAPRGPAAPPAELAGDHDGSTISLAELRRMREAAGDAPQQTTGTSGPDTPTEVLPAVGAPAAGHGSARLSSGQVVTLDRTVIIGRRPRATRASGDSLPHLVAVESPQQDISRSHLEIRPEGDSVVVIDLHTTNGSTLMRPGADPVRLHPGEHTLVLSGDVVDLGDGVTVSFEGLT